jgi:hypothetical protein
LDTQHHLAAFYLGSEASIRLTAEQAHFFLVRPLDCLPSGVNFFQWVLSTCKRGEYGEEPG